MTSTERWHEIRTLEDMKALLWDIENRLLCIRTHGANQSGNWTQVFVEAEMAMRCVRAMKHDFDHTWNRLYHLAKTGELPRGDEHERT